MSQRTYYSEEAKQKAQMKTTIIVGLCLALGATIGSVIAIMFAPQSGEDTRDELNEAVEDRLDKGRDTTNTVLKNLQTQIDDLRERFSEMAS